jgi:hypothetical protein
MNPMVDVKQFEQHGEGFGETSQATVTELNKALEAGVAMQPTSGGGALRVESLDATLKIVSFMMKNIIFYNDIPKTKAYNTVEEYNLLAKYGGKGGFFIAEGGLPRTEDSDYQRKVQFVKFMGTTREISHPMLLVRPAHGNVVALETKNGAMWMLQRMEEALWGANSDIISQSFNGVEKQLIDGYADSNTAGDGKPDVSSEHVLDLRGRYLTEGVFAEAARILLDNYMYPTHCYLNHVNHRDYNVGFFAKLRGSIPQGNDQETTGFDSRRVKTAGGTIELRPSVFLRIDQKAPTASDNSTCPTAPTSATVTADTAVTQGFAATERVFALSEVGVYAYGVSAISKNGESAITAGNASATVTSTNVAVKVVIVPGAVSGNDATAGYRIYRTRLEDGATGSKYLIAEIAASGTTTFHDGNADLPGAGKCYVGQMDESVLTLRELSPMLKFPLATVASSVRWMQLYYNTPIVFRPRGWIVIKNIGRLNIPEFA